MGPLWAPRVLALLAVVQVAAGLAWAWSGGQWGYGTLLFTLPALWRLGWVCLRPRPGARPKGFPADVWPLWYSAAGFRFARASGLALVAAALIEGVW